MVPLDKTQSQILYDLDSSSYHFYINSDLYFLKDPCLSENFCPLIPSSSNADVQASIITPKSILNSVFLRSVLTIIARISRKVSRIVVMMVLMLNLTSCATKLHASTDEPIIGKTELSFEQIAAFILSNNPDFDPEIAKHYVDIGIKYGIRAEIAISQAILETGWFKFKQGTKVKPDHHNYCGLGVTSSGTKGCSFDCTGDGVTAHIQHLFAYATDKPLPQGETLIDPRFKYVKRACAPSLSGLTGTWAASNQYSKQILSIYNRMQAFVKKKCSEANQ